MIEEVDVNAFLDDNLGPRKILSGEEYFETNPNDISYDMDGTNRDLCGGPNEYTMDAVIMSPRGNSHELNQKEPFDSNYKLLNNTTTEGDDIESLKKDYDSVKHEKN
jgi:hypothetical protein